MKGPDAFSLSAQLQEVARSLLRDEKVAMIIGYEEGSLPLRTSPCIVRSPDDAERLIWNACCENNLATYLRGLERGEDDKKIGVVTKGCDGRAIVGIIQERQLEREDLFVVAVPCQGVIDRTKIAAHLRGNEILEATLADGAITVSGDGFNESLPLEDFLCASCRTCEHRTSPIYDTLIGDPVPAVEVNDNFEEVSALEAQSTEGRWAYFGREFSKCIRCYACREACPLCYCTECFVDQTQPVWFGKSDDYSDTLIFHIVRALHLAGRCVDCGACSRACPMGIDLRALNRRMIKDVRGWYGYEAGMDLEAVPPLSTFAADDPQEFIK